MLPVDQAVIGSRSRVRTPSLITYFSATVRCGRARLAVHRIAHREPVGLQRAGRRKEEDVGVEVAVRRVRDDRCSHRQIGAQAAGMIEVMVRIDDVADGLVRI